MASAPIQLRLAMVESPYKRQHDWEESNEA